MSGAFRRAGPGTFQPGRCAFPTTIAAPRWPRALQVDQVRNSPEAFTAVPETQQQTAFYRAKGLRSQKLVVNVTRS
jgi:hypothetical protein